MTKATLQIELDETVKDNKLFQSKLDLLICKPEIFKYGILVEEVPSHVKESDFEFLQSKIPAYEMLHSEFINVKSKKIENLSQDDRKKKTLSEIIGVAFGIKYSVELLKTNPNKFKKIGISKTGKYLDYSLILDNKEYELETKGTVQKYYAKFKSDILKKKKDQKDKKVYLRFGTIAMINNPSDTKNSRCVIVDDPPNEDNTTNFDDVFETQLLNYAIFLSYILDSKYYNKYVRPLQKDQIKRVRINNQKFYTKYHFKSKVYFGECFDYRLIRDDLQNYKSNNLNTVFDLQQEKYGKTKIFIGLDLTVIEAINEKDIDFLKRIYLRLDL